MRILLDTSLLVEGERRNLVAKNADLSRRSLAKTEGVPDISPGLALAAPKQREGRRQEPTRGPRSPIIFPLPLGGEG
jgi:hypothetical protein